MHIAQKSRVLKVLEFCAVTPDLSRIFALVSVDWTCDTRGS